MMTGTGKEPRGGVGVAVETKVEAAADALPGVVPAGRRRVGTDRVRRPADLLLAVFAVAVAAVVLGAIKALPLGSAEAADDVSRWLLHIPGWLKYAAAVLAGVSCFIL